MNTIEQIETAQLRDDIPEFSPGDNVRVNVRVIEGVRERVQAYEGVVIARQGGSGSRATLPILPSCLALVITFAKYAPSCAVT